MLNTRRFFCHRTCLIPAPACRHTCPTLAGRLLCQAETKNKTILAEVFNGCFVFCYSLSPIDRHSFSEVGPMEARVTANTVPAGIAP
jgi:hypothetical protein